jgi:hypothetical protein
MPVQLRFATNLTSDQYVSSQAWREANLALCPAHGSRACGFSRHGTYARKSPQGTRIPRWYCHAAHRTFSLLADCFASRLPGTLAECEEVLVAIEQAPSQETAVQSLRTEIELAGVLRWVRRRLWLVRAALISLLGLFPARFGTATPTLSDFRRVLGIHPALPELREIADAHLASLPPPLGFGPRPMRAPPRL